MKNFIDINTINDLRKFYKIYYEDCKDDIAAQIENALNESEESILKKQTLEALILDIYNAPNKILSLRETIWDSKVAFYIFFHVCSTQEIIKFRHQFNKLYKTKYSCSIRGFLEFHKFDNIDQWTSYVENYALDYYYNVILRSDNKKVI